jgi:hypothetical protein
VSEKLKQTVFVGRVVEMYRELPWSAYGRSVPKGHPPDEKPARLSVEVDGSLELTAILPPDAARDLEVGSIIKVVIAPSTDSELMEFRQSQS